MTAEELERRTRRQWLRAISAISIGVGLAGGLRLAGAHDDEDDDDDNSGRGHGDDDDHGRDHDEDDAPQLLGSPVSGVTTIEIRDEAFIPPQIIIDPGQTVTWHNLDDDEHTATGAKFDTGVLDRDDSAEIRFDTPGVYAFVCQFHAHMQGSVTVRGEVATPAASPQASPAVSGGDAAISIIDFAFDPPKLTIPAGTRVTWTNTGAAPHTVTGDFLSTDLLQPGSTAEFTFTTPGSYPYVCALHAQMSAEIVVE